MAFFQLHGQRILASGSSIAEVLRIFNTLPVVMTMVTDCSFLFQEVLLQTAFQHKNTPAEVDRSPSETFEMGTDR